MTADSGRISLGQITGAHGVRGAVLVRTYTQAPEDITSYGVLTDADGIRRFKLKIVRVTSKGVIARVAGIDDRTAAEALKGMRLFVDRARLPDTAAEEFYHVDLIGLAAVTLSGEVIGDVLAVHNFGAGDILEIRLTRSGKTEMLPFTQAFVPEVNISSRRITVALPAPSADEDAQ
jgi:16S rRNA processing protein RimM